MIAAPKARIVSPREREGLRREPGALRLLFGKLRDPRVPADLPEDEVAERRPGRERRDDAEQQAAHGRRWRRQVHEVVPTTCGCARCRPGNSGWGAIRPRGRRTSIRGGWWKQGPTRSARRR